MEFVMKKIDWFSSVYQKNKDWNAFKASLVGGFIVHFYVLANGLLNHDSIILSKNNLDWVLCQGKWFVTPLCSIEGPLVLSYISAVIGMIAIGFISELVCYMYRIKQKEMKWIVGGLIAIFPS